MSISGYWASPAAKPWPDGVDWDAVRDQFPLKDEMIYLNCGTVGSMPRRTLERYECYNWDWAKNPSYHFFDSPKFGQDQQDNRAAIGQFTGADARDICLTNNTTMGLAMALLGLPLEPSDEILTSNQEHWSLSATLALLKERRGIKIVEVPVQVPLQDGPGVVDDFCKAITPYTKIIAISHITWATGAQLPVKLICKLAKEKNIITVIDGAHALGALSLDMMDLGCDFYATSGHKWLNGPPGSGVLYIRDAGSNPTKLSPILSENTPGSSAYPISTRLQIRGCNNTPAFAGMVDASAFADELGRDLIESRILKLSAYTKKRIIEVWGKEALFSPSPNLPNLCSGMTAFVPSRDSDAGFNPEFISAVVRSLWTQSRIYVRSTLFPTPPQAKNAHYAIRVSTNIYNNFLEIDRLIEETLRITRLL